MRPVEDNTYEHGKVPLGYACDGCGATGVRLYRQYQPPSNLPVETYCHWCSEKRNDFVPAVPSVSGVFWGYFVIPKECGEWWKSLPRSKAQATP